jgi:nitrogen regulation protein NR(I)
MHRVLVIDDDDTVRDVLKTFLTNKGYEVMAGESGEAGLDLLRAEQFDAILTDLVMPGLGGMDILREVIASKSAVPVIMITAHGTVQTAVEAMKNGAFDYVTKPFNLDELTIVLEKAESVTKLKRENVMLRQQLKRKYDFKGLVGHAPRMERVYDLIDKIADTDSTILITGESGTGKELIAKTIHYNSSRSQGPFVPINCGAIPKDLLESELFGHEKGAFTGAINTRVGRFELAQHGTLLLDEVGELDPSLQVKLLRVLQEREFERVGGVKTIKIDVRILAATNKDLERHTKEGKFREDLFYRLNVIPIHVPPLRARTEDIPLLLSHFIGEFAKRRKREPFTFSPEAMDALLKYRWPGNVRELENLVERTSILVSGPVVNVSDLPEKFHQLTFKDLGISEPTPAGSDEAARSAASPSVAAAASGIDFPDEGIDLNQIIDNLERALITRALERSEGVRSRAAQLLGLNRTTLIEKIKKMGIEMQKK